MHKYPAACNLRRMLNASEQSDVPAAVACSVPLNKAVQSYLNVALATWHHLTSNPGTFLNLLGIYNDQITPCLLGLLSVLHRVQQVML